jgi:hypothetical protein
MRPAHRNRPLTRKPVAGVALLLAMLPLAPLGGAAVAANKPTTPGTTVPPSVSTSVLKPPVKSASTGSLKTSRQTLLKQRTTSVTGLNDRHPGKIIGTTAPAPKTIVTKRFLPK